MNSSNSRGPIGVLKAALEQRARSQSATDVGGLGVGPRSPDYYRQWARKVRESASPPSLSDAEADRLAEEATADCVTARAYLLKASGRIAEAQALQRQGWRLGRSTGERMTLTFECSEGDEEFVQIVAAADESRDQGRWNAAALMYERALHLYPLHHGYRVQWAHMLKEQELFAAAEIQYRSARALGAPPADVDRHLEFVSQRQGHGWPPPPVLNARPTPMQEPPTQLLVETLAYLIWQSESVPEQDMLKFLRSCRSGDDVAARMIADDRFVYRGGKLLALPGAQS
jgi:hypothetical protein